MSLTTLARTGLRTEYRLLRRPLSFLDQQVLTRYAPTPVQATVERGLGAMDVRAGRVLDDPESIARGEALLQRAASLAEAYELRVNAGQLGGAAATAGGRLMSAFEAVEQAVEEQEIQTEMAAERREKSELETLAEAREEAERQQDKAEAAARIRAKTVENRR